MATHGLLLTVLQTIEGATLESDAFSYKTIDEFGGAIRFAELYHPADSGRDCDMERKYAGKVRARKNRNFQKKENSHIAAIKSHLRHLGKGGAKVARVLEAIKEEDESSSATT